MPKRTPSICSRPGCTNVTSKGRGYCDDCNERHNKRDRVQRGSSWRRGYDTRHKKWRTMILARDILCQRCLTVLQRFEPATVADHIIPWRGRAPELKLSMENGQGLCAPCHNVKGKYEAKGEFPDWRKK